MSMHGSFLAHANKRWLWVALALLLVTLVAYAWHSPTGATPNGGTWLGYTLGTVGALLIRRRCEAVVGVDDAGDVVLLLHLGDFVVYILGLNVRFRGEARHTGRRGRDAARKRHERRREERRSHGHSTLFTFLHTSHSYHPLIGIIIQSIDFTFSRNFLGGGILEA